MNIDLSLFISFVQLFFFISLPQNPKAKSSLPERTLQHMTLPSAHPFKFKGQPSTVNNFEFTSTNPPYIWILSNQNGYCYFAFAIKDSWQDLSDRRFSVLPYQCWSKKQLNDCLTKHSKFYGEKTQKTFWIDLERIYRLPESKLAHFIDKAVNFDFESLHQLHLLNDSYKKIVDEKAFVFDYATEYTSINAVSHQEIQPFLTQEIYDNQIQSFIVKELTTWAKLPITTTPLQKSFDWKELTDFIFDKEYKLVRELGKLKVVSPFENDKKQTKVDFIIELKKMAQYNPKNQSN